MEKKMVQNEPKAFPFLLEINQCAKQSHELIEFKEFYNIFTKNVTCNTFIKKQSDNVKYTVNEFCEKM